MIRTMRVVASIKFTAVYTCGHCGKMHPGTTAHRDFDRNMISSLMEDLLQLELRAADMPMGWASFAKNIFLCAECHPKLGGNYPEAPKS